MSNASQEKTVDPRFALLGHRPGKVIAVHLSYASRAAERGRTPAALSYFLKPSSSIAPSGTVERPEGCELLAYEGEVALVIGAPARNVSIQEAWSHVRAVTAANDLGVYDYRAADKGSNVRSKGRDGYTALGPALLDATQFGPDQIRVRSWLDGGLVQDGPADDLIFPFPQIVADLSQHMTLEEGDVILAGTPAGSSVFVPGQVIEVEVDVPSIPGLTTGRLRTEAVQGTVPFDPALGSLPEADDKQRADAYGPGCLPAPAAETAAAPAEGPRAGARPTSSINEELRAVLEEVPVAALSGELRRRGIQETHIDGPVPVHPDKKLVGRARTLRFVAGRPDLFEQYGGGNNTQKQAFDDLDAGDVLVIEARGQATSGTLGDILAIRAKALGAAGIVTDGGVRDYDAVAETGLPVYTAGPHPAVLGRLHVPWDRDTTIVCGGATVQPGDILVGDHDGVIVLPADIAEDVARTALRNEERDAWIAQRVAEGNPIDGLFPMNPEWKDRYENRGDSE